MFYIKLRDIEDRSRLIAWLEEAEILAVFHYIPLHSCPAGEQLGEFRGEDRCHHSGEKGASGTPAAVLQSVCGEPADGD
ncbi:hypothetical protein MJK72_01485 [Klebsiella pneumoniae]|nr:hypothetical protein MJK72_01485 [Klebsiella pneumoniae]